MMKMTDSATPSLPYSARCWQWCGLAPSVAIGVSAVAKIAREVNFPGPWQAITGFFYVINAALILPSAEKLTNRITHLKSKQNWQVVSKLRHIKALFLSTLSLIVSTTFTVTGLKETCELLGRSVKSLESGLSAVLPWVKGASRITALFQIYDIVHGMKFREEIKQALAFTRATSKDRLDFCARILGIVERHYYHLRGWERPFSLSKQIAIIRVQMKGSDGDDREEGKLSLLSDRVAEFASLLLRFSKHDIHYQVGGLFINVLYFATLVVTNTTGFAVLLLGASIASISREVWNSHGRSLHHDS